MVFFYLKINEEPLSELFLKWQKKDTTKTIFKNLEIRTEQIKSYTLLLNFSVYKISKKITPTKFNI